MYVSQKFGSRDRLAPGRRRNESKVAKYIVGRAWYLEDLKSRNLLAEMSEWEEGIISS